MKNVLLLFGLLASCFTFAQTPFTHYFGATGKLNNLEDFTQSSDGNYRLYAYGNYNAQLDYNLLTYNYATTEGLLDSVISVQPGNQLLFSAEEDGNGGAVVCSRTRLPNKALADIMIQYFNADGNEIANIILGEESLELPQHTAIDEQQNYFVNYRKAASIYTGSVAYYANHLRMINATRETAYDIEIDLPGGGVFDLVPLGNGEVVVIAINDTPTIQDQAEIIKVSATGAILWRTSFNATEDDISFLTQGFYDGQEIYLADYVGRKFITLDVDNGNLSGALSYPEEVFGDFFFPFVKYQNDIWIFTRASIYHLAPNGTDFDLMASYPVDTDQVPRARFRTEGAWEYLSDEGKLSRFDLSTTEITTLGQVEIGDTYTATERTANVMLVDDQIYAGVSQFQAARSSVVMNRFSADAHLISSIATEPMSFFRVPQVAMLQNGGAATLTVNLNEDNLFELALDIYDEAGALVSENTLIEDISPSISVSKILVFADGDLGIYFSLIDFGTYTSFFYKIDPEAPTTTPLFTFVNDELYGGNIDLKNGSLGLASLRSGNNQVTVSLQKIQLTSGVIWQAEGLFTELQNTRTYNSSGLSIAGSTVDEVLLGLNLQTEDQPPIYHVKRFDDLGNNSLDFTSSNPYLSAQATFLNDEQIIVVGCDFNANSTGTEDLYTLRYETYDQLGNLLSVVNNDLPYEISVAGLEVLNDEFIVVYGQVYQDADRDAYVILMDQAGEITNILTEGLPVWGALTIGPNPSTDLLRIQLENDFLGEVAINVYTVGGRLLGAWTAEKAFQQMTWETSLAELPAGSYWVQVKSPAGQVTAGWVKQ